MRLLESIEEVGSDVRDLVAGDRVIIDQGRTCISEHRTAGVRVLPERRLTSVRGLQGTRHHRDAGWLRRVRHCAGAQCGSTAVGPGRQSKRR